MRHEVTQAWGAESPNNSSQRESRLGRGEYTVVQQRRAGTCELHIKRLICAHHEHDTLRDTSTTTPHTRRLNSQLAACQPPIHILGLTLHTQTHDTGATLMLDLLRPLSSTYLAVYAYALFLFCQRLHSSRRLAFVFAACVAVAAHAPSTYTRIRPSLTVPTSIPGGTGKGMRRACRGDLP